ncbi:putative GIY-YIG superfamily endonuclease [Bradyrhizobium diazoefficiens]|nr:excinuclease ABC subunit C [Bradyrhizobium diazoefficiens]
MISCAVSTSTRSKAVPGVTTKYGIDKLVLFEIYDDPASAIAREKELKKWASGLEDALDRGAEPELG